MADSFCRGLRAQHEESAGENRRPIRAPPVEIARYASPPRPGACSFPIPMIPRLPILLCFMARDTTGYWQQQVAYRITARLDEPAGVLSGHARITYVNRSPNTLHDFFVHQHLNAFRPGSRWAAADSAEGRERFQHLQDPDYAFERITGSTVMGDPVKPDYPYAPDSTIAHVTLDLPEDQVIGATGVPVEGDPGWEHAKADPQLRIDYQRDWYGRRPAGLGCGVVAAGRKCVRFHAEQVHHFAFSLNPQYVYEEGRQGDVLVRVLYLPGDSATWGKGIAVRNTRAALAWLDSLYGKFAWPSLTNVHRIESGGTEFPMMVMDGSAGLGLIVHEVGHNYTMGILANNEWREAFLDEGFTSFQTSWFFETHGGRSQYPAVEADVLLLDLDRWSEPVSLASERFRDFFTYNQMVYDKAQLFYEQLRYVVGDDTMRRILRAYYARWKLKHVDEDCFREVAEEISGRDLKWLFGQWLHGTPLIDYSLKRVKRTRQADGRWLTAVTIERKGDGWMPVEIGDRRGDTIYARATGQPATEVVEFTTAGRPGRLMLDPRVRTHDYNMLNNRERGGLTGRGAWTLRIDNPFQETVRRDGGVRGLLPVVWSNDFGGGTVGLRERANYLGRYDRGLVLGTVATRPGASQALGMYGRWSNPVGGLTPRTTTSLAGWLTEGRAGAAIRADRSLRQHLGFGADLHVGFDAMWMATTDLGYLDRRLWDDAGTIEAGPWVATTARRGAAVLRARLGGRSGVGYFNPGRGAVSRNRYDFEAFGRFTGAASVRTSLLGARVFAGAYLGQSDPVRQRQISIAGADPYETFTNPLLRSRGALLVRPDFHYQAPGGANLRGFRPDLGGRWAIGVNLEVTPWVLRRDQGILRGVGLEGFVDAGVGEQQMIQL